MKTERIIALVSREQAKAVAARAKSLKISTGEYVRKALDAYDPDADAEAFTELAKELHETVKRLKTRLRESQTEREAYLQERAHVV
jgi:hypothetical protein